MNAAVRFAPASFAQRQFWLLDRLTGGHPVYNAPRRYHLTGPLDVPALERALGEIALRHETLRTRLPERKGEPIQEILPASPVHIPVVDLTGQGEATRDRLAAFERAESRRAFDLAAGPTWRAALARLAPTEHVLFLTFHHVVFDGWSRLVLEKELAALYGAFVSGEPSPLGDLQVQYADYAAWEYERLSGDFLERLLAYWQEQLSELPFVELPTDRQRPPRASFDGARHQFEIPVMLAQRVRSFAASQKATPFMTLMALFQALVSRLTGLDDVPVGCPTSGRTMPGTEGLIGCFINPVVVRGDLSGNPTFKELVGRTRQRTIHALSHAELRFELLVLKLRPERVQGVNPLFQVLFQLRTFPRTPMEMLPGLTVESGFVDTGGATVDQAWSLNAYGDCFAAEVDYDTALFDESTVRRMGERFLRMLEGAMADPDAQLSDLPLLDEGERQRIQIEWNETATAYPRERSIVELFVEHAERDPEAVAVERGDEQVLYRELDERSSRLAGALMESGVEPGTLVGLCMKRSIEMVVGMLAALRSGAAYVPLDPDDPDERLSFMSKDARLVAVLVEAGHEQRAFGPGITVLAETTSIQGSPSHGATATRVPGPEDLAYVLYTSGSSGLPKGVAVEHRAVVRLVRDTDYVSIGPGDRVAHVSHPAFDATTFEVWAALLNGATVVILDSDTVLEPPRLARQLQDRGVTELFLTTALFNAVADETPGAFRTVRTVMFGGETVDPARVRKVLAAEPPARLLHVYGPTECTTFATWHSVTEVDATAATIPIGRPIANTRAWVVDPHGCIVPAGVPGELLLGGDGLARGYHDRPELTRERFVDAPFGGGERVYRTGDRVRRDEDGSIVFLGRLDRQVKIRGFRIELGEVEAALASHPSVRECVVAARETAPGDRRLLAWVVANAHSPTSADLNRFLSESLPRYMLPSAYVVVNALPLNRNGKVDVKALPDPPAPESGARLLTETERLLADVWRETLGVSEVGRTDDFYDLGGHSLLAVRLFSEIEQRTGRRLPIAIFDHGLTIAAVAECLERETTAAGTDFLVPIRSGGPRPPLFLVHGGGGHVFLYRWLASELDGDRPVFGFNLKGVRRDDIPRTVEEMAESYVNDLEVAYPEGPCLLGGYSFGGVVAWEMARRLRARGRAVPLLVLFEATPDLLQAHSAPVRAGRKVRRLGGVVVRTLADVSRKPPDKWSLILSQPIEAVRSTLRDRQPDLSAGPADEAAAMMATTRWAVRHYRPGRYPGRTLYLQAADQVWRKLVWRSLAEDLEVVILPANGHASFLKQANAPAVAKFLGSRLREADGG